MSTLPKSSAEFYDQYKDEVLSLANELTDFSEGSMHDILAGAISVCCNEVTELIVTEFSKTFFSLASGDDLENLAIDHFGENFAKDDAIKATGIIKFSRPNADSGNVIIESGTIVKTKKDSNGEEIRFQTLTEVTMTGLSIETNIEAMNVGTIGNILSVDKITVIEGALTDPSITVTNESNTAGGSNEPTDEEYLETIKNKIVALAGATQQAVESSAKSVAGVALVKGITEEKVVIEYDIANEEIKAGSSFFRIPYPILYIADANGNSSDELINSVKNTILFVRACGVKIDVRGAVPVNFNWTASVTLNAGGPNYAELSEDLSKIIDSMTDYINTKLEIGEGFNKFIANAYILSIWGVDGTNDITSFSSSVPSGNVDIATNEKLIANNIQIV